MSFIPITPDLIENVTLALHPVRSIVSSSDGVTGSISLISRPSSFVKKIPGTTSVYAEGTQNSLNSYLIAASNNSNAGIADVSGDLKQYFNLVEQQSESPVNSIKFSPLRYSQPVTFSNDNGSPFFLKKIIQESLMPFYRHGYSICDFSCGNFHTLNFFTGSNTPGNTGIIYANTSSDIGRQYTPPGPFSVDFYINPRYLSASGSEFTAGTIMHLSSTFAISLVTGSQRDNNQNKDAYRILLQLSHSADTPPADLNLASVDAGLSYPNDLVFLSADNSLQHNNWHHVTVRWGGRSRSYGTGSIVIDGNATYFNVPSSSIATYLNSEALVIGNYYEGSDLNGKFFNTISSQNEGIPLLNGYTDDPTGFSFRHPLQAEIHDLKIFNRFLSDTDISTYRTQSDSTDPDLLLYVPPVFSSETNQREILVTPFQSKQGTTEAPFNVDMSYGVNGFYMNLENFVKDYASGLFPRLYNLSGSVSSATIVNETANQILYSDSKIAKRNLTILPNDNGILKPDFSVISAQTSSFFLNDLGVLDHSKISMKDMAPGKFFPGLPGDFSAIGGASPEDMQQPAGPGLTIAQRFKDTSSNQVVIFDLSNIAYGRNIQPETFEIIDSQLSGSSDKVKITVADDGFGSLYRADCHTTHAKWSSVGNVFYREGVAILTPPTLSQFGKDHFEMALKGEHRIPVSIINVPCPAGLINSSSNPTYEAFPVTQYPNEREDRFVYITGINLHDENLNVIMRANLAQPIAKRDSDEFMFRIKYDF
jgi:hypothetical protein